MSVVPRKPPTVEVEMSGCTCLYRRASGIYVVRLTVPLRLRRLIGRGEIHASTHLRDSNAAKLAASRILMHWRERFMALDTQGEPPGNPLFLGDGLIPIVEAARVIGIAPGLLLSELSNDRAPIYVQAQNWKGWHIPDIGDVERDYDGSFVLNDIARKGDARLYSGPLRCHDSAAACGGLMVDAKFSESVFLFPGAAAFVIDPEQSIALPACMAQKSSIERIRARLVGLVVAPAQEARPLIGSTSNESGIANDPISTRHGKKRFSELVRLHRESRQWSAVQEKRMATEAGLFCELMGDPFLSEIEVGTILEYARLLAKLPNNVYQSRRKFGVESLIDLIAVAEGQPIPLKEDATVKGHVGRLSEILNFGKKKGMLHFNPASDFKRGRGKAGQRDQDQRDVFSPVELERIFSQEWFINGTGEFSDRGKTKWRPYYYWLPLLALHTGARLNELSQLYLDDVVQAKNDPSIWYLDFNLAGGDKLDSDAGDKSLKTVNSIRIVPLHDSLIAFGLLEYVLALREAGHVRLFPELKRDRLKGYGKPVGSWFNERFLGKTLGMKRDGKKTFHSFRHVFIDAVSDTEPPISERVINQLSGHERGKGQGMKRYAKDRDAEALKPIIDRLNFPSVSGVGKFKVTSGLRAIDCALRSKEAARRASLA